MPASLPQPAPGVQYVVVIRHGERLDAATSTDDPTGDPPLTERGKAMVAAAAERLGQVVPGDALRSAGVRSSPFRRCRETADGLIAAGIGAHCGADGSTISGAAMLPAGGFVVDNTLCEVFGALRIKTDTAPQVALSKAEGQLPAWGEGIDAAAARYNASMAASADAAFPTSLVLVTHGDALMAVLSRWYPQRLVYNCEYLGFLVFSRPTPRRPFALVAADGVDWIADESGDEGIETATRAAYNDDDAGVGDVPLIAAAAAADTDDLREARRAEPPMTELVPVYGGSGGGVMAQPDGAVRARSPSGSDRPGSIRGRGASSAHSLLGEPRVLAIPISDAGPSTPPAEKPPCRQHDPRISLALRVAAVASQLPLLRLWPDFRSALIYTSIVVAAELISWRLPSALRDRSMLNESAPLVGHRKLTVPLLATLVKFVLVFMVFAPVATAVAAAMSERPGGPVATLASSFTSVPTVLCFGAYALLDALRGYIDNLRRCA